MIETNCIVCGSGARIKLFNQEGVDPYFDLLKINLSTKDLNWYRCRNCSLVYRSPKLEPDELKLLYAKYELGNNSQGLDDDYFDKIVRIPNQYSENFQKIDWLQSIIKKQVQNVETDFKILDVGCGAGTLLHTAGQKFASSQLFGVEPNAIYANICIKRVTKNVVIDNFNTNTFSEEFDLILNTKVLEHIDDPRPFLADLSFIMSEHSFLFLEVPDVSEVEKLPPHHDRFGIPHIYFYSTETLTKLLNEQNLKVLAARVHETHRKRSYLQIICQKGGK